MEPPPYPKVSIDEYCIIHLELGSGEITIQQLREVNSKQRALSKTPRPVMVICDATNKVLVRTEAMEYFSTNEATEITTAVAVVAQSFIQRYLAKILVTFHCPPKPTRIFANRQEAIEWLRFCEGAENKQQKSA